MGGSGHKRRPPQRQPAPAPTRPTTFAEGKAAYQRGDYATAISIFRPLLADQGDAVAQNDLGCLYEKAGVSRRTTPRRRGGIARLPTKALPHAQSNLGCLYAYGRGVAQDYAEAARWCRKAADQGYTNAQNSLGILFAKAWASHRIPPRRSGGFARLLGVPARGR